MSKKIELIKKAAAAVIMLTVLMTTMAFGVTEEYSTETDPLVSLSYINGVVIPDLEKYVDDKVNNVSAEQIAAELLGNEEFRQYVSSVVSSMSSGSQGAASGTEFITLKLSAGKRIIAGGKCELILRSGKAAVISSGSGAVKDLSADKTLGNGDGVVTGNFIEISYSDGSGIAVLQSNTEILIRGEFTVGE